MNKYLEKIKKTSDKYQKQRKELSASLIDEIGKIFKVMMEDSKVIHSYVFNQYSPYFNDGDPCEFSSNHQYGCFYRELLLDEYGDEIEVEDLSEYADSETCAADLVRMKNLKEVLSVIPDDFYEDAFGHSAEITIYRDGTVEVDDDFEHD